MRRRGVAGVGAIGVVAALGALGLASGGLSALSTALTTENTEGRENTGGVAWRRGLASAEAPVADAAMRRDSLRVRALIREGADVNAAQGDGMTALHWAAIMVMRRRLGCSSAPARASMR